jgi:hypothetical protein
MKYRDRQSCGAGDQAAGLQLENRYRTDHIARGSEVIVGTLGTIYGIEQQNTHRLQA